MHEARLSQVEIALKAAELSEGTGTIVWDGDSYGTDSFTYAVMLVRRCAMHRRRREQCTCNQRARSPCARVERLFTCVTS